MNNAIFFIIFYFFSLSVWSSDNAFTLSEKRFRQLGQVQESLLAEKYNDALDRLDNIIKKRNNAYEKAMILRLYADVFIALDKYPQAISFLQ
jgi:hypothetical protein